MYGRSATLTHFEFDIETPQCEMVDHVVHVREFGSFGPQELSACRRVEKEIADVHRRAARMRDHLRVRCVAAGGLETPAVF
jgi:hypothetical protein